MHWTCILVSFFAWRQKHIHIWHIDQKNRNNLFPKFLITDINVLKFCDDLIDHRIAPTYEDCVTTSACGLFWTEGNQDTADSRKTYTSLLTTWRIWRRAWCRDRKVTRELFSGWPICMTGQTSNYQTSALLTVLSVILPFEAPDPCPIP